MANNDRNKWTYFGEFFEAIARQGIDEMKAAEAMLELLKGGLHAAGYRRQFTFPDHDKVERLPRDVHPQPVPIHYWRESGEVKGDMTSYRDDKLKEDDLPEEWIEIDWVSGSISSVEFEYVNVEHILTEFSAVRIPRKDADVLLHNLAGVPKRRAGRPPGPSNDWERAQIAEALRLIAAGDSRASTAIANGLTDPKLTGKALESQRRRLAWGINQVRSQPAKNPPKNKRD